MSSPQTLRVLTSSGGLPIWMMLIHLYISYVVAEDITRVVGRIGDSIFLHPEIDLQAKIPDMTWKHANMYIAKKGKLTNLMDRCKLFLNGSLKFYEGLKTDSGYYTVELFNDDGELISKRHIELSILDVEDNNYVEMHKYLRPQEETKTNPDQDTSQY
ncbi:unnamed protein product, partial [Coregonus sp. 'balchen']